MTTSYDSLSGKENMVQGSSLNKTDDEKGRVSAANATPKTPGQSGKPAQLDWHTRAALLQEQLRAARSSFQSPSEKRMSLGPATTKPLLTGASTSSLAASSLSFDKASIRAGTLASSLVGSTALDARISSYASRHAERKPLLSSTSKAAGYEDRIRELMRAKEEEKLRAKDKVVDKTEVDGEKERYPEKDALAQKDLPKTQMLPPRTPVKETGKTLDDKSARVLQMMQMVRRDLKTSSHTPQTAAQYAAKLGVDLSGGSNTVENSASVNPPPPSSDRSTAPPAQSLKERCEIPSRRSGALALSSSSSSSAPALVSEEGACVTGPSAPSPRGGTISAMLRDPRRHPTTDQAPDEPAAGIEANRQVKQQVGTGAFEIAHPEKASGQSSAAISPSRGSHESRIKDLLNKERSKINVLKETSLKESPRKTSDRPFAACDSSSERPSSPRHLPPPPTQRELKTELDTVSVQPSAREYHLNYPKGDTTLKSNSDPNRSSSPKLDLVSAMNAISNEISTLNPSEVVVNPVDSSQKSTETVSYPEKTSTDEKSEVSSAGAEATSSGSNLKAPTKALVDDSRTMGRSQVEVPTSEVASALEGISQPVMVDESSRSDPKLGDDIVTPSAKKSTKEEGGTFSPAKQVVVAKDEVAREDVLQEQEEDAGNILEEPAPQAPGEVIVEEGNAANAKEEKEKKDEAETGPSMQVPGEMADTAEVDMRRPAVQMCGMATPPSAACVSGHSPTVTFSREQSGISGIRRYASTSSPSVEGDNGEVTSATPSATPTRNPDCVESTPPPHAGKETPEPIGCDRLVDALSNRNDPIPVRDGKLVPNAQVVEKAKEEVEKTEGVTIDQAWDRVQKEGMMKTPEPKCEESTGEDMGRSEHGGASNSVYQGPANPEARDGSTSDGNCFSEVQFSESPVVKVDKGSVSPAKEKGKDENADILPEDVAASVMNLFNAGGRQNEGGGGGKGPDNLLLDSQELDFSIPQRFESYDSSDLPPCISSSSSPVSTRKGVLLSQERERFASGSEKTLPFGLDRSNQSYSRASAEAPVEADFAANALAPCVQAPSEEEKKEEDTKSDFGNQRDECFDSIADASIEDEDSVPSEICCMKSPTVDSSAVILAETPAPVSSFEDCNLAALEDPISASPYSPFIPVALNVSEENTPEDVGNAEKGGAQGSMAACPDSSTDQEDAQADENARDAGVDVSIHAEDDERSGFSLRLSMSVKALPPTVLGSVSNHSSDGAREEGSLCFSRESVSDEKLACEDPITLEGASEVVSSEVLLSTPPAHSGSIGVEKREEVEKAESSRRCTLDLNILDMNASPLSDATETVPELAERPQPPMREFVANASINREIVETGEAKTVAYDPNPYSAGDEAYADEIAAAAASIPEEGNSMVLASESAGRVAQDEEVMREVGDGALVESEDFRDDEMNLAVPEEYEGGVREGRGDSEARVEGDATENASWSEVGNREEAAAVVKEEEEDEDKELAHIEKFRKKEGIVIFSTSMRTIRATYDACEKVRNTFQLMGVDYEDRDISMSSEWREELEARIGGKTTLPRVFVNGTYLGGQKEIEHLNENYQLQGVLKQQGIEVGQGSGTGGVGRQTVEWVICFCCSGSKKIEDHDGFVIACDECNENGMMPWTQEDDEKYAAMAEQEDYDYQ